MRSLLFVSVIALAMTVGIPNVSAEDAPVTPVMVSLLTPAQAPSPDWDVKGLRLDILYGCCRDLYGLDVGLVNHTTGKQIGLALGLVNYTEKSFTGLQLGGVNIGEEVNALQLGLYNEADDLSGVQIGLINHARIARGLQVGLINVIESNDLQFLPIVNFFF